MRGKRGSGTSRACSGDSILWVFADTPAPDTRERPHPPEIWARTPPSWYLRLSRAVDHEENTPGAMRALKTLEATYSNPTTIKSLTAAERSVYGARPGGRSKMNDELHCDGEKNKDCALPPRRQSDRLRRELRSAAFAANFVRKESDRLWRWFLPTMARCACTSNAATDSRFLSIHILILNIRPQELLILLLSA